MGPCDGWTGAEMGAALWPSTWPCWWHQSGPRVSRDIRPQTDTQTQTHTSHNAMRARHSEAASCFILSSSISLIDIFCSRRPINGSHRLIAFIWLIQIKHGYKIRYSISFGWLMIPANLSPSPLCEPTMPRNFCVNNFKSWERPNFAQNCLFKTILYLPWHGCWIHQRWSATLA